MKYNKINEMADLVSSGMNDILNSEELYVDYGDAYGDFTHNHFPRFETLSKHRKNPSWY